MNGVRPYHRTTIGFAYEIIEIVPNRIDVGVYRWWALTNRSDGYSTRQWHPIWLSTSQGTVVSTVNRPRQREHEHRDQKRPNEALDCAQQLRAKPGADRARSQNKRNKRLDAQQHIPEPARRF